MSRPGKGFRAGSAIAREIRISGEGAGACGRAGAGTEPLPFPSSSPGLGTKPEGPRRQRVQPGDISEAGATAASCLWPLTIQAAPSLSLSLKPELILLKQGELWFSHAPLDASFSVEPSFAAPAHKP